MQKKKRRPLGYETKHCMWLIQWAHRMAPTIPELALLFHITNEGKRSRAAAGIAKAMGLKKGVFDYFLPVPRVWRPSANSSTVARDSHGLWIEMKRPDEKLTKEQEWWDKSMNRWSYATRTCYSWPEAANAILEYLGRVERV